MKQTASKPVAVAVLTIVVGLISQGKSAHGADTTEPFEPGASDMELYVAGDGIGRTTPETWVSMEGVAGYGITDRIATTLALSAGANGYLANPEGQLGLGFFANAVDTDHLDFDLMLRTSLGGPGLSRFELAPGLELNIDAKPDLSLWGLYLRSGIGAWGQSTVTGTGASGWKTYLDIPALAGIYLTVAEKHMLIVEYDMNFPAINTDTRGVEVGGVAVGYNVHVLEHLEMINQISFDIPGRGESFAVGLMTGFIATLK